MEILYHIADSFTYPEGQVSPHKLKENVIRCKLMKELLKQSAKGDSQKCQTKQPNDLVHEQMVKGCSAQYNLPVYLNEKCLQKIEAWY